MTITIGFDKIRKSRNTTIEAYDAGSARYERNAAKDQKKWLAELEENFIDVEEEEENSQISTMVLPGMSEFSNKEIVFDSHQSEVPAMFILISQYHLFF